MSDPLSTSDLELRALLIVEQGDSAAIQGGVATALNAYVQAHLVAPWLPHPLFKCGVLRLSLGERERAKTYFEAALELSPAFAPARIELERLEDVQRDERLWLAIKDLTDDATC
jgi:tetratricopeptide (TPR) repeat protein